jgi:hypothetical protein
MQLIELEDHISIMLDHYKVTYKKINLVRGISTQFVISDFGVIVCCISRADYSQVKEVVTDQFKHWRVAYVTTNDNMIEKRYEILWELIKSGYMKWLRYTYPRQVKSLINGPENLGNRIIEERLRIWGNKPKYRFFVEDNISVKNNGILRELSSDPSFFDFMPEEE